MSVQLTASERRHRAVIRSRRFSMGGLLERLFAEAFRGLVYPQIWEDPQVDMAALALKPGFHMIAIASGGCNVLSYLSANPGSITAVDLSPAHVALTRLKLAAARLLPSWRDYYRFFGEANDGVNVAAYNIFLRERIDEETRRYFDSRDAQIRRNMVDELAKLHRDLPELTVLYVTHDQSEALTLADRIAILRDGKLNALGPSRGLYRHPPSRFAAEFLGRANILPAVAERIDERSGMTSVRFGEARLTAQSGPRVVAGGRCLLCVRPHALRLVGAEDDNRLIGTVEAVLWQGDSHHITLRVGSETMRLTVPPVANPPNRGAQLAAYFAAGEATVIAGEADPV